MSGGAEPVSAEFWLIDAPDSLLGQSHHNPDGTGLGIFDEQGRPVVHKAPISAFTDAAFAHEARQERSRTFLAHVRFASTGPLTLANTHPFEQEGRLFAHNGVLSGLGELEAELGGDLALVKGQTDSERLFALITRETRRREGDVRAGIIAAVAWVAENLPLYSLNLIVTTDSEVLALRYPNTNTLFLLDRAAGGHGGDGVMRHHSGIGTRVRCDEAARRRVVVLASEPMDEDPGWRALGSGELLRVDGQLNVQSEIAIAGPPVHLLSLGDLNEHGRASQAGSSPAAEG